MPTVFYWSRPRATTRRAASRIGAFASRAPLRDANHELRAVLLQWRFLILPKLPPEAHMAEIQPFRAFRYDTNRVPLEKALTQPYDKITPTMQEQYYAASPYNLIAVEKGRAGAGDTPENNAYTRAGNKIKEWIAEKVLVQDSAPAIYVYSQEYFVPGT